jgi:hypothetical protein
MNETRHLTTHSTGLAISKSFIFEVNCSPVNSSVSPLSLNNRSNLMKFGTLLLGMVISFTVIGARTSEAVALDICVADTLSVASVSGRVLAKWNKGETPFNNAIVTLIRGGNHGPVIAKQIIKEDGRFSFRIKPGKYQLKVSAEGLRNFYLDLQVIRSGASKDQREIIVIVSPDTTKSCTGSYAELRGKIE